MLFKKLRSCVNSVLRFGIQRYDGYHNQMIDILNVKYLRRSVEKRESYLATIALMIMEPNAEYASVAQAIEKYSKEENIPVFEIQLEGMQYPDNIVW